MAKTQAVPPLIVLFGEEEHRKLRLLEDVLDRVLPPPVDRSLCLASWDASRSVEQGGPTIAAVLEDLMTLPFLAERRVVVVRSADAFISTHRERLEAYFGAPSPTGVLVLECRSFPKTTRLYKQAEARGAWIEECKKLAGRAVAEFVSAEAARLGKRMAPSAVARLIDLVGPEAGTLASEVEKLALYAGERPDITEHDVAELVGQSREEKIFAVADAAGQGALARSLVLWRQVLESDPEAPYRVVGGLAFVLRRWLLAHRLREGGQPVAAIAPRVMMWGRERELEAILRRNPPRKVRAQLAALAELDAQAKSGLRSIETGIELLLTQLAA